MGVDVTWDTEGPAKDFVKQYDLPYLVGRDSSGWIGSKYGVEATPNTFFIGKDGTLVEQGEGCAHGSAACPDLRRMPFGSDPLERIRAWITRDLHLPLAATDLARSAGMGPARAQKKTVSQALKSL